MIILGLSCFYHDAAACLLRDGSIVAACQEERFSRVKHDWRFPSESIRYCLRTAGISGGDIDLVCFYEKPLLKFERVLETFLSVAPRGYKAFVDTIPSWIRLKLWLPHILSKDPGYKGKVLYAKHHLSHAASAFFTSPFDEAAILTVDGVGEWATAAYGYGKGNAVTITHEMHFPHSLGLLYSAITAYLGFRVNNDEYKVMGMAPYGRPEFYDAMTKKLIRVRDDGSLALDLDYFSFQFGRGMYNRKNMEALFGIPPRDAAAPLTALHFNVAASLQKVTETVMLKMAGHVYRETGMRNLCLAGGVALNSVSNGRIIRESPFSDIFIQPAAGDAGAAVGAAYTAYHMYLDKNDRHPLGTLYLGPSFDRIDVIGAVETAGLPFEELSDSELAPVVARHLADGKVVGWFQGGMEFGPRALGNRSILADPRDPAMKHLINQKVKFRESFRPFAPVIPEEDAADYFKLDRPSPYMLFTVPVLTDRIPAVTHVDGSARVQTVTRDQNPRYHSLLQHFGQITGIPVLLNTSLNIKGDPIAMTPAHAIHCLLHSDIDLLVIGNVLCSRKR